jgi:23S rRNA (guanosine2251-2'-O)-methyltransferase
VVIYGINAVIEALRAGRVTTLRASDRGGPRVKDVARQAQELGVQVSWVEPSVLDRAARGGVHQGIVAETAAPREHTLDDLLSGATAAPLILVLDGIEDPQNFGAILRTADGAGVDGVVRQTRHAAPLEGAAAKASAGAIAHVKIAAVVNIARAVDELKEAHVWTVGLAGDADRRYDEVDLTLPTAIVVGAEGTGLRRLVRERCDWLVSIPMLGAVDSLNVSVATGVVLYEAVRQRAHAARAGR